MKERVGRPSSPYRRDRRLGREYRRAASVLGLRRDELACLAVNGVRASFLDDAAKQALIGEIGDSAVGADRPVPEGSVSAGNAQPVTGRNDLADGVDLVVEGDAATAGPSAWFR